VAGLRGTTLQQSALDEFETKEIVTDGGLIDETPGFERRDDGKPVVDDEWIGETIYTSWGYGQTNVALARVVDVSSSGRTIVAKLVTPETDSNHKTSETVSPTDETYGDEFRLYVRDSHDDSIVFRGSYPYIDGDMENGTRKDSFLLWGNRESVHQTAPGYGH